MATMTPYKAFQKKAQPETVQQGQVPHCTMAHHCCYVFALPYRCVGPLFLFFFPSVAGSGTSTLRIPTAITFSAESKHSTTV